MANAVGQLRTRLQTDRFRQQAGATPAAPTDPAFVAAGAANLRMSCLHHPPRPVPLNQVAVRLGQLLVAHHYMKVLQRGEVGGPHGVEL